MLFLITEQTPSSPAELGLDKAQQGHSYSIVSSLATGRDRMHMDALGLIPGDVVHVLFKNFSGLVVAIKGSRLALGRALAAKLRVQEFVSDERQGNAT